MIELRIRKAGDYLEHTEMSVADIARTVGYEDSQYFFRVFKRRPGRRRYNIGSSTENRNR
ncbi:MAG: helix-turn-helix domain-containing protein [Gallintestinimicrobium sp.]